MPQLLISGPWQEGVKVRNSKRRTSSHTYLLTYCGRTFSKRSVNTFSVQIWSCPEQVWEGKILNKTSFFFITLIWVSKSQWETILEQVLKFLEKFKKLITRLLCNLKKHVYDFCSDFFTFFKFSLTEQFEVPFSEKLNDKPWFENCGKSYTILYI